MAMLNVYDDIDDTTLMYLRAIYLLFTQGVMPSIGIKFLTEQDNARLGFIEIPPFTNRFVVIELVETYRVDVIKAQEILPNMTTVGSPRENAFDAEWLSEFSSIIMTPERLRKELKLGNHKALLENYYLM